MDENDVLFQKFSIPENLLQPLLKASNTSTVNRSLEILIETSKTTVGRSNLASENILPSLLQLIHLLPYPSARNLLVLSLKLIRNLCAGEVVNQNSFVEVNGVDSVLTVLGSVGLNYDLDYEIVRMGIQVLGNVSLAGEEHQNVIWRRCFPFDLSKIARVRRRETCDPLCMLIYSCVGRHELVSELCGDQGLPIVVEIIRTATAVDFEEDWFKLLLSKICFEASHFSPLFSKLYPVIKENCEDIEYGDVFVQEHAFILSILLEILNERINEITISNNFALSIFEILRRAIVVVDTTAIDVLKYSLTLIRDISSRDFHEGSINVVDSLVSSGLIDMLLHLLHELEPPTTIKKVLKQDETHKGSSSISRKSCPYKGYRRDIVGVIGNCAFRRKHVQDEIREKNGIYLLLQQCVIDEDNPFLREWGILTVRNLLEGNEENQRVVADLEVQGSITPPEIAKLGLQVEVDQKTRRAKLVNVS